MRYAVTIFLTLAISSCVSYERCVDKYGRVPSDTIKVPVEVFVPRDSIDTQLHIDSIPFLVPGDTVYIANPSSRATIRYWRNKYENTIGIQADCDSIVVRDTVYIKPPVALEPPPPGKRQRAWAKYKDAAAVALPIVILLIVALIKLRK